MVVILRICTYVSLMWPVYEKSPSMLVQNSNPGHLGVHKLLLVNDVVIVEAKSLCFFFMYICDYLCLCLCVNITKHHDAHANQLQSRLMMNIICIVCGFSHLCGIKVRCVLCVHMYIHTYGTRLRSIPEMNSN
jgi:hypothetical protein